MNPNESASELLGHGYRRAWRDVCGVRARSRRRFSGRYSKLPYKKLEKEEEKKPQSNGRKEVIE